MELSVDTVKLVGGVITIGLEPRLVPLTEKLLEVLVEPAAVLGKTPLNDAVENVMVGVTTTAETLPLQVTVLLMVAPLESNVLSVTVSLL